MTTDIEELPCSSSGFTRKKRKRECTNLKLQIDERVEVKGIEEGLQGSWHLATVIGCRDGKLTIKYDHLLNDDLSDKLIETLIIISPLIRPLPPPLVFESLNYGQCVDVLHKDAWWEGVIIDHKYGSLDRTVFFPDMGDEMMVRVDILRITQDYDWTNDIWKPRGKWVFLELLAEIEEEWPVVVSVKQIWYEVRGEVGFMNLKEWSCNVKESWKNLVIQVIVDNFKLSVMDIFVNSNHKMDIFVNSFEPIFSSILSDLGFESAQSEFKGQSTKPNQELASLMEGGSFTSLLTSSITTAHVGSQRQDLVLFSPNDAKLCRKRDKNTWLIPGPDLLPEPEYCPAAITEYIEKCNLGRKPSAADLSNVRKHLAFLNWRIEYWNDSKGKSKYRYFSPESKPRLYYSLNLLCNDFAKGLLPLVPLNDQTASISQSLAISEQQHEHLTGSSNGVLSLKTRSEAQVEKGSIDSSKGILCLSPLNDKNAPFSPLSEVVEDVRTQVECPQAIVEYVSLGGTRGRNSNLQNLRLRVKKHLLFTGWSFFYIKKGTRRELRYQSPSGRVYISLMTACQSYLANEGKSDQKAHSSRRRRTSIRAREYVALSHHTPRTILFWLINNNVITAGEKVFYRAKNGEGRVTHEEIKCNGEGRITGEGIKCNFCMCSFSVSEFEAHVDGSKNKRPAGNLYLDDGRSLLDCQRELKRISEVESDSGDSSSSDHICSVCHDGGELILCDECPSSFHISCVGLKDVPEGDWFCPLCCCGVCGQSGFSKDTEHISDNTLLICEQCEHQYHVGCMSGKNLENLEDYPKGNWFCNKKCEQIFNGLQGLLGKPIPVKGQVDNLTWTIYRNMKPIVDNDDDELTEFYSKLNVALGLMHECFDPVKESRTNRDLIEDVLFNRRSELRRLNFRGFYTVVLERKDELISVATLRVYGEKVAEVPLVGTTFQFRRLGMCRVLMDELEKELKELGVERLVLPAIESVLDTWTGRFGFSTMAQTERLGLLKYNFLYFQGTTMCQKFLFNSSLTVTEQQNIDDRNRKGKMICEGNSNFLECENVEDLSGGNCNRHINATIDDNCSIITITQPTDFECPLPSQNNHTHVEDPSLQTLPTDDDCSRLQNKLVLTSSLEDCFYSESEKEGAGFLQCYKRRKVLSACGS